MNSSRKKVLFIADSWSQLDHSRDSSLYLAKIGYQQFDLQFYWATPNSVFFNHNEISVKLDGVLTFLKNKIELTPLKDEQTSLETFYSIHWRKDPPVDLHTFQLWNLIESQTIRERFVNPISTLLTWNEKFSPFRFKEWAIPSFISCDADEMIKFISEHSNQRIVIKSVNNAASRGVKLLSKTSSLSKKELEFLIKNEGPFLMLQIFDESVYIHGEKRAIIINGKIEGVLIKMPKSNFEIMNLDQTPEHQPNLSISTLSETQKKRAELIAEELKRSQTHIASIDFIGDRLLEINITSPGLLRWYDEEIKQEKLARAYWNALL